MPNPPRSPRGHRRYSEAHERRLRFILRGRELGFTIDDLRRLLGLVDRRRVSCGEIRTAALAHLADVRRKIADLRRMERTLADTAARCRGGDVPDCPIIDTLSRQA
jgi:MerR family mercuric resistance operon transcriptional regulator